MEELTKPLLSNHFSFSLPICLKSLRLCEAQVLEPNKGLHALSGAVGETVALLLRDSWGLHVCHAWLDAFGSHLDLISFFLLFLEQVAHGFLAAHG